MGLNELFELTSQVASTALPIIGCVVLVYLAIFFKHLITVVKEASKTVQSLKTTLDTTERQLQALDKPLNTLNELSETVDYVHEAGKHAVRSTMVTIIENFSVIKDWLLGKVNKSSTDTEASEDISHE